MNKIAAIALVPYTFFCLLVFSFQNSLVFYPDQRSLKYCPRVFQMGGELVEDKKFNAHYYLRQVPDAKGTIVHFHGNAGNACGRYFVIERFKDKPFNIVLAEYPGYGGIGGVPGEKEILQGSDNLFASLKMKGMTHSLYLFGESLGTAVSTYLASKNSIKGLILQSPFTTLSEVGQYHYPILPVHLLMTNKFPLKVWAKNVQSPVLILHGEKDRIIPLRFGQEASTYFPKGSGFIKIEGRGHNDLVFSRAFWEAVHNFLDETIKI